MFKYQKLKEENVQIPKTEGGESSYTRKLRTIWKFEK